MRELRQQEEELEALSVQLENELILVSADLKSSALGKMCIRDRSPTHRESSPNEMTSSS